MQLETLLLLAALQVPVQDGMPVALTNCAVYKEDILCLADGKVINISKVEQDKVDKKVSDLKINIARQTFGAAFDIYFTEYGLKNNPDAYETNSKGFSPNSRMALKALTAAGIVLISAKLSDDGHPNWAKWISRIAMVAQIGFGVNNYLVGKDGKAAAP